MCIQTKSIILLQVYLPVTKWKWKLVSCVDSLQPHELYSPWNSPGQHIGVGSLSLLQWIFPTQGSNQGLLHCRWILYQLSYQGSPVRTCIVNAWPGFLSMHTCSVVLDSLHHHWTVAFRFLCPGDFSGKNVEVGCHFLLQGIFMIRGSNLRLLHLLLGRWVFTTESSHRGSPSS